MLTAIEVLSNRILVTISVVLETISHSSGKKICLQCSKPRFDHFYLKLYIYIFILFQYIDDHHNPSYMGNPFKEPVGMYYLIYLASSDLG